MFIFRYSDNCSFTLKFTFDHSPELNEIINLINEKINKEDSCTKENNYTLFIPKMNKWEIAAAEKAISFIQDNFIKMKKFNSKSYQDNAKGIRIRFEDGREFGGLSNQVIYDLNSSVFEKDWSGIQVYEN